MKHHTFAYFVALLALMLSSHLSAQTSLKPAAEFEGGKLYTFGEFSLVDLHGNYREMGRQYGHLMRDKLQEFYNVAFENNIEKEDAIQINGYDKISEIAYKWFQSVPNRYRKLAYGVSEESGIELEKFLIFPVLEHTRTMCSGMAVWGDYTGGKPLVFGRNMDLSPHYRDYSKFLSVTIYHPVDGSNHTAGIHYAGYFGLLGSLNIVNEYGLFLEVNAGQPSSGDIIEENRRCGVYTLWSFLMDCSSMNELDVAFHSTNTNYSCIINVADKNVSYSYEWPTYDNALRRVGERKGMLVATNYFADPYWGTSGLRDKWAAVSRRENLLKLGEKYKGSFDAKRMMDIFDIDYKVGGATNLLPTNYQFVIVPETFKLWLKAHGVQDWTEIPLGEFLKHKE